MEHSPTLSIVESRNAPRLLILLVDLATAPSTMSKNPETRTITPARMSSRGWPREKRKAARSEKTRPVAVHAVGEGIILAAPRPIRRKTLFTRPLSLSSTHRLRAVFLLEV